MHFKCFIPLFLVGGVVADVAIVQSVRAPLDGSSIARFLGELTTSMNNLDKLISDISKENVGPQMDKIIQEAGKINSMLVQNAGKINSSKPISGIVDALPLVSKFGPLTNSMNKTIQHAIEKAPIVKEAKLDGKVRDGLKASEQGVIAIIVTLSNQMAALPAPKTGSTAGPGGASMPPMPKLPKLTEEMLKPIVDTIIDDTVGVFNGSIDMNQAREHFGALLNKSKGKGTSPDGAAAILTSSTTKAPVTTQVSKTSTATDSASTPKAKSKGKGTSTDDSSSTLTSTAAPTPKSTQVPTTSAATDSASTPKAKSKGNGGSTDVSAPILTSSKSSTLVSTQVSTTSAATDSASTPKAKSKGKGTSTDGSAATLTSTAAPSSTATQVPTTSTAPEPVPRPKSKGRGRGKGRGKGKNPGKGFRLDDEYIEVEFSA